MKPATYKAVLVIADISGFTQFMKSHRHDANHAMQVVVELLKAVISAASPPLELAEVEGDAAFFYALCKQDRDITQELAAIKKQVIGFFRSFYQTLHRLCALNLCTFGAQDLRLKVIIHAGEVAIEHIHGFEKLFGMDVILAHRLLKNSVRSQEYVLMTESTYNSLGDFYQLVPERQTEYCEVIGMVETVVFYPPARLTHAAKTQPASRRSRLDEKFPASVRNCLPGDHALKSPHGQLWAVPNGYLSSAPYRYRAGRQPVETVWIAQLQTKWRHDDAIQVAGQGRQELRGARSP
ncbi:MAG: DUF2652 domain-containing protein [bacterium]